MEMAPSAPEIVIREAQAKHRPIIIAFMGELQALEATMERALADPREMAEPHVAAMEEWAARTGGAILLAMIGDSIVGLVIYGVEEAFGYYVQPQFRRSGRISDLYVEAGHRELGVGRKLINEAEDRLRALGVRRVEITTLFHNIEARNFYEVSGYQAYQVQYAKEF